MSSKETLSFLMPRRIFCPEKLLGQCSPGPFPLPSGVQERTARMSLDTVCPQYPELHQKKGSQQGVGGGLSLLCCAFLRSHSEYHVQAWALGLKLPSCSYQFQGLVWPLGSQRSTHRTLTVLGLLMLVSM